MSLRTFIAVEIGPLGEINKFEHEIKTCGAGVKLVVPGNIHITLKFLGATEEDQLDKIMEVLHECCEGIKPFTLELTGTGAFPNLNYMKVLWVGTKNFEGLEKIANSLNTKLNKLGFKSEKRGFKPHITVGRVKSKKNKGALKDVILRNQDRTFGELTVDHVCLKKSVLDSFGPTYYTLGTVMLE